MASTLSKAESEADCLRAPIEVEVARRLERFLEPVQKGFDARTSKVCVDGKRIIRVFEEVAPGPGERLDGLSRASPGP